MEQQFNNASNKVTKPMPCQCNIMLIRYCELVNIYKIKGCFWYNLQTCTFSLLTCLMEIKWYYKYIEELYTSSMVGCLRRLWISTSLRTRVTIPPACIFFFSICTINIYQHRHFSYSPVSNMYLVQILSSWLHAFNCSNVNLQSLTLTVTIMKFWVNK